ncbi:MAG: transcription termination/antitermination NusG family protein [Candidatus Korobacteraceae bacterium]
MSMMDAAALAVAQGAAQGGGVEKDKQWYAAYTCPRHEKRVWTALNGHQVESFLPTYKAVHRWRNGVKAELDLALFPGYVFVRIALRDRMQVLKVPGLVNLVGFGGAPMALPDSDVEVLRSGLQLRCQPHPFLRAGQWVTVKSGPLVGMSGILADRRQNGCRLVLSVELIQQACAIEVDACDVEAVERHPLGYC